MPEVTAASFRASTTVASLSLERLWPLSAASLSRSIGGDAISDSQGVPIMLGYDCTMMRGSRRDSRHYNYP